MQGPDFIFLLQNSNGDYYYVENGQVFTSTTPRPLPNVPDKWLEIVVTNQRNAKYFAVDRSISESLDFVKAGAHILQEVYYKLQGSEGIVNLVIGEQQLFIDATTYYFYYTQVYKGELDLSQFQHDGPRTTSNIAEGGPMKYIRAKESVTQVIPLEEGAITVEMTGIRLQQSANYLISNGALPNDLGGATIQADLLALEAVTTIGATSQPRIKTGNSASALWNLGVKFLETGAGATEVTFEWDFYMIPVLASGISPIFGTRIFFQCQVLESDSSINAIQLQSFGGGDPLLLYGRKHHFVGTATVTIPANRRCVLYMTANQNRDFTYFTYDNNGKFSIKYTYVHPTSYIQAFRPLTLFNKLIGEVTDQQYTAISNILDQYRNVVITCGDAIRGLPQPKIKTSLLQFFQAFNTVAGLGMGQILEQIRLENKAYWVDYTDPIDLGEVKDMVVSPATDYLYTAIKIGYAPEDYDDVNGKQEFNTTLEMSTPNTRVAKTYESISPYRADSYGIELTRINLDGKDTTDNEADNDVFLIHISDQAVPDLIFTAYKIDRSLNVGATGLLDPATVYNLFLSPKRCLLRNGDYIHSFFYNQENKVLKFKNLDKNNAVVADGITENADVPIASLPAPLFTPNTIKFETKGFPDLSIILAKNPLKSFKWTWGEFQWMGVPDKVTERIVDKEAQTFTMLSAPQNNLLNLINNNG